MPRRPVTPLAAFDPFLMGLEVASKTAGMMGASAIKARRLTGTRRRRGAASRR